MKGHIVLTNGRSGSNYVVNLLNAHPQITNYGEVLGQWTLAYQIHQRLGLGGASAVEYLEYLYSSRTFYYLAHMYSGVAHLKKGKKPNFKRWGQVKTLGVKDFSINFKRRKAFDFIRNSPRLFVINLYRENALRRYLSLELMDRTGVVKREKKNGGNPVPKVFLSVGSMLRKLEVFDREVKEQCALANSLPQERVFHIRYEDLFASPESQRHYRDRIFAFLAVPPRPVESSHRKIASTNLADVIANYDEVVEALRRTPFAKCLD